MSSVALPLSSASVVSFHVVQNETECASNSITSDGEYFRCLTNQTNENFKQKSS